MKVIVGLEERERAFYALAAAAEESALNQKTQFQHNGQIRKRKRRQAFAEKGSDQSISMLLQMRSGTEMDAIDLDSLL